MDKSELSRLKGLAKNATPGPWWASDDRHENLIEGKNCQWVMGLETGCPFLDNEAMPEILGQAIAECCNAKVRISEADLDFIESANPATVLALIAEVERLEEKAHTLGLLLRRLVP